MIVVTCEARVIDDRGSHLLYAATDVVTQEEPLGATLLRVAALVSAQTEEA